MEITELLEKINEWKKDMNTCTTNTMKELMERIIISGEKITNSLQILTDSYNNNKESCYNYIAFLQKVMETKDINTYISLFGKDIEQSVNESIKE